MATVLADKMFRDYNSSLLRQNTVNQSFFVLYRVSHGIQPSCQSYLLFANNDLKGLINSPNLFRYIYIYICGVVCVCVYIYIYIYTHTHTHIHTLRRVVNELCGSLVDCSWPALLYTQLQNSLRISQIIRNTQIHSVGKMQTLKRYICL
jgi:hypothetical protein